MLHTWIIWWFSCLKSALCTSTTKCKASENHINNICLDAWGYCQCVTTWAKHSDTNAAPEYMVDKF